MRVKIAILLAAAAVFATACLCSPANLIPYFYITLTPTTRPPTAVPSPSETPTRMVVPVCAQNLDRLLESSETLSEAGGPAHMNEEYPLVTYQVNGDTINHPRYADIPASLQAYQKDSAAQEKIWSFFTAVIPEDHRGMVEEFILYTDGSNGSLGAVEQTDSPQYWALEMDMVDAASTPDLAVTVIHEFAHLLTLNSSQVTTDMAVFNHPDDASIYQREAAACPNYFMYEGCSRSDSYINTFFNQFWPDIYNVWAGMDPGDDPDLLEEMLRRFYREYSDQFVTEYAATSPSEDLAESFMYFIFVPRPSGDKISDQKILFFYEYPEMVALRGRILENLCTYLNQP